MSFFKSTEEGAAHPEARLVNSFLMKKYFDDVLTERQLELLSGHLGLLDFQDLLSRSSERDKLKFLICHFCGREGEARFLPSSIIASLSHETIARAAAFTGQFELIKELELSESSLKTILEDAELAESCLSMASSKPFFDYLNVDISPRLKVKEMMISADYRGLYPLAAQNGHLAVLKHIEELLGDKKCDAIKANHFAPYSLAAKNGHLAVLKHFDGILGDEMRDAIKSRTFCAYQLAAQYGHLAILERFDAILRNEKCAAIKGNRFESYWLAAQNGHLKVLKHFDGLLRDDEKRDAIKAFDFVGYGEAAKNGHLAVLKRFEGILKDDEKCAAIKANHFGAYKNAAQNAHLGVLKHFDEILGDEKKYDAIKANHFGAYWLAARHGHLAVLKHFDGILKEEKRAAIKSLDFGAYKDAGLNGHLSVLEHFDKILGDEKCAAIKADHFWAYRNAAKNGHLEVLKHFDSILEHEKYDAIKAFDFFTYREAAKNGHLEILKHFDKILGDKKCDAIKANNFGAYKNAAQNGYLLVLKHFDGLLKDDEKRDAIKSRDFSLDFWVYREASKKGHLGVLKHFDGILGDEKCAAIKANNFGAYREAAENGHLSVLKHFDEILGDEKLDAIKAYDFGAYKYASQNGHLSIVKHLLKESSCMANAEKHDREYGEEHVYSYVSWRIDRLRKEKDLFEKARPNGVFDIDRDEACYAYYLLRNLIRRGVNREYGGITREAEALSDDIRFLLSIPAIKALCHETVTVDEDSPGHENELLRLANRIGNEEAAGILLQLPEVRRLAQAANFYSGIAGGLDLRQIAEDRESSMVALSPSEKAFVQKARSHYKEKINEQGGGDEVFKNLKSELKRRYEAAPATLALAVDENEREEVEEIPLPFEWHELQILKKGLTTPQYEAALKAYYAHDAHTAYRYLSKPNKWMHPHASYVYISDDRQDLWSTFEEYQSLIVLFYTAAFDEEAPAIDGYTLETRKALFIKQLALIGRAHNWDKRDKRSKERDDGERDRPSCFSGVMRRLAQSVLGHGLFKTVVRQTVIQALNEKIRAYFKEVISIENAQKLKEAYEGMINMEGDMDAHIRTLKTLNITPDKQALMIEAVCAQLSNAYKENFDAHRANFIENMKSYFDGGVSGAHFIDFQSPCGLDVLLQQKVRDRELVQWARGKWRHRLWQSKAKEISGVDERAISVVSITPRPAETQYHRVMTKKLRFSKDRQS